jgi:hypothetical protein
VSINRQGAIGGFYYDSQSAIHGFVRKPDGTITTFDVPGSTSTQGSSIDDRGRIAGFFLDSDFAAHGFVRRANGTVHPFDPPRSAYTVSESIESGVDGGALTGEYADSNLSRLYRNTVALRCADLTTTVVPSAEAFSCARGRF